MIVSGFTSTSTNVIQKIISRGKINYWNIYLIRSMVQMPLTGLIVILKKESFLGPKETR